MPQNTTAYTRSFTPGVTSAIRLCACLASSYLLTPGRTNAATVTVDVAGGATGGAARFRAEFYNYLAHTGRQDVQVIGDRKRVTPSWLVRREITGSACAKRVALNNVGFFAPGGERCTLLRNALHFLTEDESILPRTLSKHSDRHADGRCARSGPQIRCACCSLLIHG